MKLDIGAKLSLFSAAVILLLGSSLGFYFVRHETRSLGVELDERALVLMKSLAVSCEYPILTQNKEALFRMVNGVLEQKDVVFCRVTDRQGAMFVRAGDEDFNPHKKFKQTIVIRKATEVTGEDLIFGSSGETTAEEIGAIELHMSLAGVRQKLSHIKGATGFLVLISILLATAAIVLILRRTVISPVRALAEATAQIAKGNLSYTVRIEGEDSIGRLAQAFNKMTKDLQNVTVSRDYVDNIFRSMGDSLIVVDLDDRIRVLNQSALDLLGYQRDEIVGQSVSKVWEESSGIARSKELESHFIRKDGTKVVVAVSTTPMRGNGGQMNGLVLVAQDLTERKKMEAMMLRSEKLSAVGQLAAGVAHEINNPLGVILGFSQGLVHRLKPNDPLELPLKSIEREAVRCKNLVQDLLTFSRTSHGDREAMDINQAVDGALSLIQAQARMSRVELKKELAQGLPLILGNRNQVQQIVINLANNALDVIPDGGTLTVKTELLQDSPRSWVCLKVADTGTGIPPEILSKIFEPFFTTKPVGQGTGLGLSLVHEIVTKHSGTIDVHSRPGFTEFCVRFPARTGREIEERLQALKQEKTDATSSYAPRFGRFT